MCCKSQHFLYNVCYNIIRKNIELIVLKGKNIMSVNVKNINITIYDSEKSNKEFVVDNIAEDKLIIAVSNYIINFYNKNNKKIVNIELQKILYLIDGYYYRFFGKLLFHNGPVMWPYGPSYLGSYFMYHTQRVSQTLHPINSISIPNNNTKLKLIVEKVCGETIKLKSIWTLVEKLNKPLRIIPKDNVISSNVIKEYFKHNNPLNIEKE